jgi:hypothetical protein
MYVILKVVNFEETASVVSGHSSRLQIQRSGFDSKNYQIFWEVVGLERGPLSLVIQLRSYLEEKIEAPV